MTSVDKNFVPGRLHGTLRRFRVVTHMPMGTARNNTRRVKETDEQMIKVIRVFLERSEPGRARKRHARFVLLPPFPRELPYVGQTMMWHKQCWTVTRLQHDEGFVFRFRKRVAAPPAAGKLNP